MNSNPLLRAAFADLSGAPLGCTVATYRMPDDAKPLETPVVVLGIGDVESESTFGEDADDRAAFLSDVLLPVRIWGTYSAVRNLQSEILGRWLMTEALDEALAALPNEADRRGVVRIDLAQDVEIPSGTTNPATALYGRQAAVRVTLEPLSVPA